MKQRMWEFRTKNYSVEWTIEDDLDVDYDFEGGEEAREKVQSGEWQAFMSCVSVTLLQTGTVIARSYLGGSIYADPAEFRDHIGSKAKGHGSYFSDMVREVCKQARDYMLEVQRLRVRQ